MKQFDRITATIQVRPEHQGRPAKPELVAINGQQHQFTVAWLMDEGDPYPSEWALTARGDSIGSRALLEAGWIASGDVVEQENQ